MPTGVVGGCEEPQGEGEGGGGRRGDVDRQRLDFARDWTARRWTTWRAWER